MSVGMPITTNFTPRIYNLETLSAELNSFMGTCKAIKTRKEEANSRQKTEKKTNEFSLNIELLQYKTCMTELKRNFEKTS